MEYTESEILLTGKYVHLMTLLYVLRSKLAGTEEYIYILLSGSRFVELILHIRASTYQNSGRYESSVQNMNFHCFHTAADYAQVECNSSEYEIFLSLITAV